MSTGKGGEHPGMLQAEADHATNRESTTLTQP